MASYSEAVESGTYDKKLGLIRKYDNVRLYWEDAITEKYLYSSIQKLLKEAQSSIRRLRILDLGCGSGDGYDLLTNIHDRDSNLQDPEVKMLTPERIGYYKGIDLNQDLLNQAKTIYGHNPKLTFEQADFTKELPVNKKEEAYNLYFTSYGTCSHHNDDDTMIDLLVEIGEKTPDYAIFICDWIGRYSYEWQSLWTDDFSKIQNMDYLISYIYDEEEREKKRHELQSLSLRLMSPQEAGRIIEEANKRTKARIKTLQFFDRSIFTGRHMDTGDYNPHAQPIRRAVNSLHEPNFRTDLSTVTIDYIPRKGFPFLNEYFEYLQVAWNTLVNYAQELLICYDEQQQQFKTAPPPIPASYPQILQEMMLRIRRIVEGVGWLDTGLPRENIIEPQLGYSLRNLMTGLQQGQGCAHGFVGILEISRDNH